MSVATGATSRLRFLPDLLTPLFLIFAADASWSAWNRGLKRRAFLIGGSSLTFMGLAGVHSPLVDLGIIESPYLISLAFLGVVVAMGIELTFEAVRAAELSEEVKSNEQRLRTLLENVRLLVLGVDAEQKVSYVNPFFSETTGYPEDEIVGRPLATILPGDGEALRAKSGEAREVEWSRVELRNAGGHLSIGADVTEQRRAEAARDASAVETEQALREVRALKQRLEDEVVYLQGEIKRSGGFDEIIGDSDTIAYVLRKVEEVAPLDTTVLLEGETGVGKELFARAIHSHSPRSGRPMIKVNCASLPPNLIESELFGHEKGAFTGAARTRKGRFELASGGTLLLDEVGELPLELQTKLLRVLQEGELERVGGDRTIRVDVRLIAATNRSLEQSVTSGEFRQDLFYRLHVYPITVPPLRKRRADIPLLVEAFVSRFGSSQGKRFEAIPQPVLDELMGYDWPGNVRELENVIQRAVITSRPPTLRLAAHLIPVKPGAGTDESGYRGTLEDVDREYIQTVLELCGWRIEGERGAAELLGLHPNTLRARMRKLGIRRPVAPTP